MYSKKIMELYKHPHHQGKMKRADAVGEVISPVCGDMMTVYLKVENSVIKDVSFETMGCAVSMATSSVIADIAIGKTLDEALKITKDQVIAALGGVPDVKIHCGDLAVNSLHEAIKEYKKKART